MVKRGRAKHNLTQTGQAVLEIVLVLLVTIVLVSVLGQLYRPLAKWADRHFVDYLECLIETTELPFTTQGECTSGDMADLVKTATTADIGADKLPGASSGSASGTGSGTATGGVTSTNKPPSTNKNPARQTNGSESEGRNASSLSSNDTAGRGTFTRNRRGNQSKQGSDTAESRRRGGQNAEKQATGAASVDGSADRETGRPRAVGTAKDARKRLDRSFWNEDEEKNSPSARPKISAQKKVEAGDGDQRPVRMLASAKKAAKVTESESDFSIGDYLRILIIAAILIAIFFLIGGQALQLSKSSEK